MSDPMQEIMASFFVECEELNESLVDALQAMADGGGDDETINVAFRAVHSIKGGAGAFGLDALVGFAHQFETVMDACRAHTLVIDEKLNALFLRCSDMLSDLIRCSRDGEEIDAELSAALIAELDSWVEDTDAPSEDDQIEFLPMTIDLGDFGSSEPEDVAPPPEPGGGTEEPSRLRVVFRPDAELYESGNEPLFLIRTLADLGPCEIDLEFKAPETLDDLGRPGGRITWTVLVETEAAPAAAHEIFEFAVGLCHLEIKQMATRAEDAGPPTEKSLDLPPETVPELGVVGESEESEGNPPASPHASASEPTGSAPPPGVPGAAAMPPPVQIAAAAANSGGGQSGHKPSPTVRVDLERIERLVNLVGELVINQAMLSQSIAEEHIPPNSPVTAGLDEFMQLTRDIQESVMMIRAQPVKSLFQRMSRIVRESSAAVGKSVRLVTEGETTEIDKTAIERLADPLTHMIRNAVDHGLENPEARQANGKPKHGEIRLRAAHKSGRVMIDVADDGGGINRDKVRSIAVSKGLVPEDAVLSDGEIDQLLFLPGFSTASEVSSLSGRGVGMDVVKTQITALGGRVTIDSTPGQGTTFSISLPLTLAVLDGMVVNVAGETLVVPLNAIVETLSLSPSDLKPVAPGQHVLRVREQFVPVLDLGTELGYRAHAEMKEGTIALLISPEEGALVAMLVDAIEDQRQVVIKGLQESYGRVPGIAAATILGDGQIALILDPLDLVQNASGEDLSIFSKKAS